MVGGSSISTEYISRGESTYLVAPKSVSLSSLQVLKHKSMETYSDLTCQKDGKIQIGLAIAANRRVPELTIWKWALQEGDNEIKSCLERETIISKKKGSSQAQVTRVVLTIEFERLMLRAKDKGETPKGTSRD